MNLDIDGYGHIAGELTSSYKGDIYFNIEQNDYDGDKIPTYRELQLQTNPSNPRSPGVVAYIIDNKMINEITLTDPNIYSYTKEIEYYSGIGTIIVSYDWQRAKQIRDQLKSLYQKGNLVGAVIVGNLPYMQLTYLDSAGNNYYYPTDLYYSDLDETYWDNSIFTDTEPKNNLLPSDDLISNHPDIFIGNIRPPVINSIALNENTRFEWEKTHILSYFAKTINYMNGKLIYSNNIMIYIDEWFYINSEKTSSRTEFPESNIDNYFESKTVIDTKSELETSKTDFLRRISIEHYKVFHLLVHGSAQEFDFLDGPQHNRYWNFLSLSDIENDDKDNPRRINSVWLFLDSCSVGDYSNKISAEYGDDEIRYIAGSMIFEEPEYALGAFALTSPSSFAVGDHYKYFNDGSIIGKSYMHLFENTDMNDRKASYTYIGDPTLKT